MSQPPGNVILHLPVRPTTGPINIIDERISLMSSSGISLLSSPEDFTVIVLPSINALHPR